MTLVSAWRGAAREVEVLAIVQGVGAELTVGPRASGIAAFMRAETSIFTWLKFPDAAQEQKHAWPLLSQTTAKQKQRLNGLSLQGGIKAGQPFLTRELSSCPSTGPYVTSFFC